MTDGNGFLQILGLCLVAGLDASTCAATIMYANALLITTTICITSQALALQVTSLYTWESISTECYYTQFCLPRAVIS